MARLLAVSLDVMVGDKFIKTIFVRPTRWLIMQDSLVEALAQDEIVRVVEEECPYTFKNENWRVELNDESTWKYSK